jgi:hypothetical protein
MKPEADGVCLHRAAGQMPLDRGLAAPRSGNLLTEMQRGHASTPISSQNGATVHTNTAKDHLLMTSVH